MNREELTAHLIRMRELKLRNEVEQLKLRAAQLEQIERLHADASSAAYDAGGFALQIRDLGLFGAIRLDCTRLAGQVANQVRALGRRVTQTHKLTQSARETHARITGEKRAAQERSRERDADLFFSWKRGPRSGS